MSETTLLVVFVVLIAVAAALAARFGARWYFERSNSVQHALGSNGVMIGAEPVELEGDGEVGVLLLHGFGDTPQTMRDLAIALHDRGYGVAVPLLPGHGRTLPVFVRSASDEWLAHALEVLNRLRSRYPRVAVVGLSMGGALGSLLASTHSDVITLVLIAPYISVPNTVRRVARWRGVLNHLLPYFPGLGSRSIHDSKAAAENLAYGALNATILSELVELVDRAFAQLPSLKMPVLMLQSREDNRIPVEAAERIYGNVGSADKRLVWVSGCGHILTVDYCREVVTNEVVEWLARHVPLRNKQTGR